MKQALYKYRVFKDEGFIYAKYKGRFDLNHLLKATNYVWDDPNYRTDIHGAIDLREALFEIKLKDVKALAKILVKSPKKTKARISILVRQKKTAGLVLSLLYLIGGLMDIHIYELPENAMKFVHKEPKFFEFLENSELNEYNLNEVAANP